MYFLKVKRKDNSICFMINFLHWLIVLDGTNEKLIEIKIDNTEEGRKNNDEELSNGKRI